MQINEIEAELQELVSNDKKQWVRIYELMKEVEDNKLYAPQHKSFSAWVNNFATVNKVHVSILWARKKAGSVYSDYEKRALEKGEEVAKIEEVTVSPDNFVLVDKIAGKDTAVADTLISKIVSGELTRSDLKSAWETKRANKENVRVNRYGSPAERKEETPEKITEDKITATNVVLALSEPKWLPAQPKSESAWLSSKSKFQRQEKYLKLTEFPVSTGTTHHSRRIDALVLETISDEWSKLSIHGIEIKVSKSDLLSDHKMQEYCDFVDYFWLAVPEELVEDARSIKLEEWGIIMVTYPGRSAFPKAEVIDEATKLNPRLRAQTLENAVLKLL